MKLPQPYYEDAMVTLYQGDCLALLPALEADVLVTDPPYGVNFKGVLNDHDTSHRDAVLAWWGDKPALVFGADGLPASSRRVLLVWDKTPATGTTGTPWRRAHELIAVLGNWPTDHMHSSNSLFRHVPPTHKAKDWTHPTEKPVQLMRWLLKSCPPGVVLDPFAGAGTTLRAAKDLGRRAIGVELDPHYCEVAASRLAQGVLAFPQAPTVGLQGTFGGDAA